MTDQPTTPAPATPPAPSAETIINNPAIDRAFAEIDNLHNLLTHLKVEDTQTIHLLALLALLGNRIPLDTKARICRTLASRYHVGGF